MSLINRGRIHLSVDIESTAGPILLAELGKLYSQENVLVFNTEMGKLIRLSELHSSPLHSLLHKGKEIFQHTPFASLIDNLTTSSPYPVNPRLNWLDVDDLPPETAAIHGHYQPDLFDSIVENPFISIVLREPLERAVAQFLEWKNHKGNVQWRIDIPYDRAMTFRDFAFRKELKNFQFKSLGDKRLGDFDLVGITQCLDGYIQQLHGKEPQKNADRSSKHEIRAARYKKIGITDELQEEFREHNRKDYDLYQMAKDFVGYCD